ncbi:Clan CA, family C1, cathepsin L-like cysteine peptidase [Trichomonas vaginalis G3]|uniref:Clan CA, family C1, cathepsin L-like cysteine peptidase n=2 Tax=Trichomonas vaginalis TaxID=5722 RepID=A0A8U0WPQ2_TRIV3|nr:cysteine proteinase [Trichomonas vaginalis G3]EAY06906.1 Clan CA, family C1, cathepsin L-like cysteine peptidase [Trichomonas vaginalis G3]KAI5513929.1 cysteine proteinase [Trichomonas vaginalis G3]CAA54436.1 cysteine proteinase, putative [Trichomonas vaginalis]|eukprot:XP_001319129.1 Clan CA, family C1, cathepsin L-like cysteine peptidase [Trichomonas vaginalis G3]
MFAFLLSGATSNVLKHEEKAFLAYMRETGNFFTGDEYHFRLGIYLANKRLVQEHNAANKGFKLGLNKLAHLTQSEYRSLLGAKRLGQKSGNFFKCDAPANDAVDWRDKGIVNKIKDQGQCGSCWAFSAIQASESRYAQANKQLLDLAEQNIVDCVTSCYGCNGGWPSKAIDYVVKHQAGKFMLTADYPYTARDGTCKFHASKSVGLTKGYDEVKDTEAELAKAASKGVVSVCIDASHYSFQLYTSGIYDEPSCSAWNLDHAVGLVGYGTEGSKNYWIVRNSWGTSWGEQGYIRMIKDKSNQCGIASEAILPKAL